MAAGATSQNREPGFDLPAGIYRRQAWRPAGLRGVDSILSGIARRTKPFDGHRARLTAWYEQFVQRSQPFVGWSPLPTAEWDTRDTQYSLGSTRAEEQISRRESPMISKELPSVARPVSVAQDQASATHLHRFPAEQQRPQEASASRQSISGLIHTVAKGEQLSSDLSGPHERPMQPAVQPVAPRARWEIADRAGLARSPEISQHPAKDASHPREAWGSEPPLAAPMQRREEQTLERPALRLAILRPINTAAGMVQRKESDPLSSGSSRFSMAETNDLRGLEYSLVEEQSAFPPRLVSSLSSLQPQEVRGGFPVHVAAEVRGDADTSSDDLVGASVRDTSGFRNDEAMGSRSLVSSRPAEVPELAATPFVALPGVQIRLLKPDERAPATQPPGSNVAEGGRSTIARKPQAPVPAAPPPLDINAVADKVYHALQRRFQLERERRGLF